MWDDSLAEGAKAWAEKLAKSEEMEHSKVDGYIENIYMGMLAAKTCEDADKYW